MRRFSVAEAEALIPELEAIFADVAALAARAEEKASLLRRDEGAAEPSADAAIARAQIEFLARRAEERLSRVAELGALVKGVRPALVDFPHRLAGRDVYLCWRLGETTVAHWHGTDEGFDRRRPLP